ncbi:MAG: 1-deoxy-D-xylulose-5-phosphate reductoisomerase, partial [Pseudomonadota bacterium]
EAPDETRFPSLSLARRAMQEGGLSGAILNGAKEVALEAFIHRRIGFLDMAEVVAEVMDRLGNGGDATSIEAVYAADENARRLADERVRALAARMAAG